MSRLLVFKKVFCAALLITLSTVSLSFSATNTTLADLQRELDEVEHNFQSESSLLKEEKKTLDVQYSKKLTEVVGSTKEIETSLQNDFIKNKCPSLNSSLPLTKECSDIKSKIVNLKAIAQPVNDQYVKDLKVLNDKNRKIEENYKTLKNKIRSEMEVFPNEARSSSDLLMKEAKQRNKDFTYEATIHDQIKKKFSKEQFEALKRMMKIVDHNECGEYSDTSISRCYYIANYSETFVSKAYNREDVRLDMIKQYHLTDTELNIANKLKPYIQEYYELEQWLDYDAAIATADETSKRGGLPMIYTTKWPKPKFPRPNGFLSSTTSVNINELQGGSNITPSTTTSETLLEATNTQSLINEKPKKVNMFNRYVSKFKNWLGF